MDRPIIAGFYPDPSACRVGDDVYLVNSSFEYLPGVPVHTSRDLVTWRLVGHVFEGFEQLDLRGAGSSRGVFAPTIRHHDGVFFVITTDIGTVMDGHVISHATDPAGPWSVPVRVEGIRGIDPDLFWDVDGTCHVSGLGFGAPELSGIVSVPIDPMTGRQLGPVRKLWQGSGLANPEGPHLYRIGEWYYCLLAEGGTERGHAVTIARSTSLDGPWEPCPRNPVLSHRSSTHVVQNTGHADLLELADGSWAAVLLGVRPRGITPHFHVNGRETFVVGIDWVDGWPVVDEARFTVPGADHAFRDDFTGALDQRWVSPAGVHLSAVHGADDGGVWVDPIDVRGPALCVRARDNAWTVEAVAAEGRLALQVYLATDYWAEVRVEDGAAVAELFVAGIRAELGRVPLVEPVLALQASSIDIVPTTPFSVSAPDEVVLGVRTEAGLQEVARFDGRLLSTELAGGFTGRMIGVRAVDAPARLASFSYVPR